VIRAIDKYLSKLIVFVLVIQGVGLVTLIGIEVLFRYVIGQALSWPEEVAEIVFVWFTLLGVAVVLQEDSHISFDFLLKRLPAVIGKAISLLSLLIIAGYAVFMIYFGYTYATTFSFATSPAANINLLWLNTSLPIAGFFIFSFALLKIIELFNPEREEPTQS